MERIEAFWDDFSMSGSNFTICTGDKVEWNWDTKVPQNILLEHFIVKYTPEDAPQNPAPFDGMEFSNYDSVNTMNYSFRFSEPGVYHTETHTNLDSRPARSTITVERFCPPRPIRIFVKGYEADYISPQNSSKEESPVDSGNGERLKRNSEEPSVGDNVTLPECQAESLEGLSEGLQFLYTPCATPILERVEPSSGSMLETVFTLHGHLFGIAVTDNEVMVGNLSCTVLSSSEKELSCRLAATETNTSYHLLPKASVPFSVSLRVIEENRGYAVVTDSSVTQITLLPTICDISPSTGSLGGGTDVTIRGHTLSFSNETSVGVELSFPCDILEVHHTMIKCRTEPVEAGGTYNVSFYKLNENLDTLCANSLNCTGCTFTFMEADTPQVTSVSPIIVDEFNPPTRITLEGSGFSTTLEENVVRIGDSLCPVNTAGSDSIACTLEPLPASNYSLSLEILNLVEDQSLGFAVIPDALSTINVQGFLTSVEPSEGSIEGGTELTVAGYGFHVGLQTTTVALGGNPCTVKSVNLTSLTCVTAPAQVEGIHRVQVTSSGEGFTSAVDFEFAFGSTPRVSSISPTSGQTGTVVQIEGQLFSANPTPNTISVKIGESVCTVDPLSSNDSVLTCSVGDNFVGEYGIDIVVLSYGRAQVSPGVRFLYTLRVDAIVPLFGSYAGLNLLRVLGLGFDPSDVQITVCDRLCVPTDTVPLFDEIECTVPPSTASVSQGEVSCDVRVSSLGATVVLENVYSYHADLTPVVVSVNRTRGGTQGGSALWIELENAPVGPASVSIARSECQVSFQDDGGGVACVTGASSRTVCDKVQVRIESADTILYALSDVEFCYVDLWSSVFTWGGGPLPTEGDFVVIAKGQTVVLDTRTPILSFLLIQGGNLIFDPEASDNQVELHTQGALITSGGRLQIGTEENPYPTKTTTVLYGHVLSTEIPIYGAKTLALREGVLDIHGRTLNVTWTKLSQTARAGNFTLHLREAVDWEEGGEIVIASTSFSPRENEHMEIASIAPAEDGNGCILTLTTPLRYDHVSVQQVIAGRTVDTSAEVGYLTRNVVVRGNVNEEWVEEVVGCEEEFRPGQFQVQTCFRGRFGNDTTASDQFGAQIFIHAPEKSKGLVTARLGYMEVTHAGQAFRLGRYPIHFHLSGDVSGSYVRGCAVHHTFNRAVTVHGVDRLLVEKNVAYDVLGHAYFMEDGNEQYNTIQDNLGVYVQGSSSLLNVDQTPAVFWIVNPNNRVRRNAAAGSTHLGFWFRSPEHPTGPSFNASHCPNKQRVLEFANNTAHSLGWFGLWVFRKYYPTVSGDCWDNEPAPAHFAGFVAWHCDKGVEFVECGSVRLVDSVILDCKQAGVEVTQLTSTTWEAERGAAISDTLIVGYSNLSAESDDACTLVGIKTPPSYYLTVSSVTFVNFDRAGCYPVLACAQCKDKQGGFETRYDNITFVGVGPEITRWQWEHEHVHRDLDGTLTRTGQPSLLVPASEVLDPLKCQESIQTDQSGGARGAICDGSLRLGRVAIFDPSPSSLAFASITISNGHGTITLPYVAKRLLPGGPGYMSLLPMNDVYLITWLQGQSFVNISYSMTVTGFDAAAEYMIFTQTYNQRPDLISIGGVTTPLNGSVTDNPSLVQTRSYTIDGDNTSTSVSFIVKEVDSGRLVRYDTYACLFPDCMVPTLPPPIPLERPSSALNWSDTSIWAGNRLPGAGEDVTINGSIYIVLDIALPPLGRLEILNGATLEVGDGRDHVIEADFVIILGGRLVAGYPDEPFRSKLKFVLHGSISTQEYRPRRGTAVGAKAMGVFGELILNAVLTGPSWTLLSLTAAIGDDHIEVVDDITGWREGQVLFITSTTFEAYQSEVVVIASVNGRTVVLNDTLKHAHQGIDAPPHYSIRAEVGLLSRNIVVEAGEMAQANEDSFGCRVLVSSLAPYIGSALLSGVEFRGCGQLGFTDDGDPRFALAFLDLGRSTSYVRECSFHDSFNTAIGVFATDEVQITGNTIHGTVGPSMVVTGSGHNVSYNLASLAQFIGTYRDRDEPKNSLWTANYEVADTWNLTFTHNRAAGGAKACFHTSGEECSGDGLSTIRSNTGHSCLHGVHMGYRDGSVSECCLFHDFTLYSCFHYGFFGYSSCAVVISRSTLVGNKAGVYVSVIGPASLAHSVGTKHVTIEHTTIVSANPDTRCQDDAIIPDIANHPISHRGIVSRTNGHVGVVIPSFVSGSGHFPLFAWNSVSSYPAIGGLTIIRNVTFVNFGTGCAGDSDTIITPNPQSEDCNHPVHFEGVKFVGEEDVEPLKLYVPTPNIRRVNPSDCVDMDCDGFKQMLLKDTDGSFTGHDTPRTIVSVAEFEWDGDARRGIGDYRIPRSMLTEPDGSRVDANDVYPEKGIVRTAGGMGGNCTLATEWNAHVCVGMNHKLLVVESLDADTETRRISPVGIGSGNGYINLLNGPMDHGWCGGYTCQERISTLYGVVAAGLEYAIGLTSTNPQAFALHLLNAGDEDVLVLAIFHNTPQRLDVYVMEEEDGGRDRYVPPKNAFFTEDSVLEYMELDPNLPLDQFYPTLADARGANYYDRRTKQMIVTVRGNVTYKIVTVPVIVLAANLMIPIEDFFEESLLVRNLALLLGIPSNKIRVVNVVRESRRKRQADDEELEITVEIGNAPSDQDESEETDGEEDLSFDELSDILGDLAEALELGEVFEYPVVAVVLTRPLEPVTDPTNGTRATPDTGGPQPGDNVTTPTFYEQQLEEEGHPEDSPSSVVISMPDHLLIEQLAHDAVEGLPGTGLCLAMHNKDGSLSVSLGAIVPWMLTAVIAVGPSDAFLAQPTANFLLGRACFEGIVFSHQGAYILDFNVTYPPGANIHLLASVLVKERNLGLRITQQPLGGNTTFVLYPYPSVELLDLAGAGSRVSEHSWRNMSWYVEAHVEGTGDVYSAQLRGGVAVFENVRVYSAGSYDLSVILFEVSGEGRVYFDRVSSSSQRFDVIEVPLTRFFYMFLGVNFQSIAGDNQPQFEETFELWFLIQFPKLEVANITVEANGGVAGGGAIAKQTEGGFTVSLFVVALDISDLFDAVTKISQGPNFDFPLIFGGVVLIPTSITQDSSLPVELPSSDRNNVLAFSLATIIPSISLFTGGAAFVLVVVAVYRKYHRHKVSAAMIRVSKFCTQRVHTSSGSMNSVSRIASMSTAFVPWVWLQIQGLGS